MESKKSPAGAIKSGVVLICFLLAACQGVQRTVGPENRIGLKTRMEIQPSFTLMSL